MIAEEANQQTERRYGFYCDELQRGLFEEEQAEIA